MKGKVGRAIELKHIVYPADFLSFTTSSLSDCRRAADGSLETEEGACT